MWMTCWLPWQPCPKPVDAAPADVPHDTHTSADTQALASRLASVITPDGALENTLFLAPLSPSDGGCLQLHAIGAPRAWGQEAPDTHRRHRQHRLYPLLAHCFGPQPRTSHPAATLCRRLFCAHFCAHARRPADRSRPRGHSLPHLFFAKVTHHAFATRTPRARQPLACCRAAHGGHRIPRCTPAYTSHRTSRSHTHCDCRSATGSPVPASGQPHFGRHRTAVWPAWAAPAIPCLLFACCTAKGGVVGGGSGSTLEPRAQTTATTPRTARG